MVKKNIVLILVFTSIACLQVGMSIYRDQKEQEIINREEAKKQILDNDDFQLAESKLTSLEPQVVLSNSSNTIVTDVVTTETSDIENDEDQELVKKGNTCYKQLKDAIINNESKPETYVELGHNIDIQSPRCIVVTIDYTIINYANNKFKRRCIGTHKFSAEGKLSVSISDEVIQRF